MRCFDLNTTIYQELKKASGISEFKLRAFTSAFYDKYGKFPQLDLIPGADSEAFIKLELKTDLVGNYNRVSIKKVLEYTGTKDLKEALHVLNNKFRDKDITLKEVHNGNAFIDIRKRASIYGDLYLVGDLDINTEVEHVDSVGILNSMINRLNDLYGVKMHSMTQEEIQANDNLRQLNADKALAFVYDGEVYINTTFAEIDAPLHELMHMIVGLVKYQDPELYKKLLEAVLKVPEFEKKFREFENRSGNDITEEILVTEYSKFITDPFYDGMFNNLDKTVEHDLFYNITRAIDNALAPVLSSASTGDPRLMSRSAMDLAKLLGSSMVIPLRLGTLADSVQNRQVNNTKKSLLESGVISLTCV